MEGRKIDGGIESKRMIRIEIAGTDGKRYPLRVELVNSGPINEDGVAAWHEYKGPQTGDVFRADWNQMERKYMAMPMD